MKTNVIMQSKDRQLFGITIKQETKNSFLSLSALQKAYEAARLDHGWSERRVDVIMQTQDFKERVYYLLKERGIINTTILGFIEDVNNLGIAKVLKSLGVYKTTGARHTKEVMCDPYIWVLLAMELNPLIYAKVVMWLTDSLIFDRIEAGKEYRPMNDAIKKVIPNPEYFRYAIAINERVFGKHFTGIRDFATAEQLKQIAKIETDVITVADYGALKTHEDIIKLIKTTKI